VPMYAGGHAKKFLSDLPVLGRQTNPQSAPGIGYGDYQSIDELVTFTRNCRHIAGALVRATQANQQILEIYNLVHELLNIGAQTLALSEQTKSVVTRALTQLQLPEHDSVHFEMATRPGIEMFNGTALEVEYDVLHATQVVPGRKDANGMLIEAPVGINMPLPNSTESTASLDYWQRLVDLRSACITISSDVRAMFVQLDSLVSEFTKSDLFVNQTALKTKAKTVLEISNKLASFTRSKNNMPLQSQIQRRFSFHPRSSNR